MRQEFTINSSSAAFDVLSKKLYSNPILAVIRELSTNANDAHIAANVSKSFAVHLPNEDEPYFSVRDFGKGIAEDEIFTIYTSFFTSTKSADDSQTGYFGLGSKSPFAVSDEFTVKSYCEGLCKTYLMKKLDGIPTVKKMEEDPSNETGLEIIVPIEDNHYTWYSTACNFFSGSTFFPSLNIDDDRLTDILEERDHNLKEGISVGGPKLRIIVAGVSFVPNLWNSALENAREMLSPRNLSATIYANKNDVTITPSREELHLDEKTLEFIKTKVSTLIEEYESNVYDNGTWEELKNAENHCGGFNSELVEKLKELRKNIYVYNDEVEVLIDCRDSENPALINAFNNRKFTGNTVTTSRCRKAYGHENYAAVRGEYWDKALKLFGDAKVIVKINEIKVPKTSTVGGRTSNAGKPSVRYNTAAAKWGQYLLKYPTSGRQFYGKVSDYTDVKIVKVPYFSYKLRDQFNAINKMFGVNIAAFEIKSAPWFERDMKLLGGIPYESFIKDYVDKVEEEYGERYRAYRETTIIKRASYRIRDTFEELKKHAASITDQKLLKEFSDYDSADTLYADIIENRDFIEAFIHIDDDDEKSYFEKAYPMVNYLYDSVPANVMLEYVKALNR